MPLVRSSPRHNRSALALLCVHRANLHRHCQSPGWIPLLNSGNLFPIGCRDMCSLVRAWTAIITAEASASSAGWGRLWSWSQPRRHLTDTGVRTALTTDSIILRAKGRFSVTPRLPVFDDFGDGTAYVNVDDIRAGPFDKPGRLSHDLRIGAEDLECLMALLLAPLRLIQDVFLLL